MISRLGGLPATPSTPPPARQRYRPEPARRVVNGADGLTVDYAVENRLRQGITQPVRWMALWTAKES